MNDIFIDIVFCALFVLVAFIAIALLPCAGISLRQFSLPSLFIIYYLCFDYIGILSLYFQWDPYPVSIGVVDREIVLEMFLYSSTALILIICGFIYARQAIGLNLHGTQHRVLFSANATQCMFVFFLFLLCGSVLLAYLRQIETIALLKAFEGDRIGAEVARSNMGNAFEGKYWRYRIFFRELLDYCVVFFFAHYLIKRRRISILIFAGCFLTAAFSATMATAKFELTTLLIMLYLAYVITKGGKYWQRATKYFLCMTLTLLVVMYFYFMGSRDVASALWQIAGRVVTGQIQSAYFYLELFPRRMDYLWGTSFTNPGGIFPFEVFPLTKYVGDMINRQTLEAGIVGSSPTVFWGEMHANFGLTGVLISSFLVGLGVFAVSHILSKLPLSPPVIAATVSLAMHYGVLTRTSLSNYFFDPTLMAIAAVTFVGLLFARRGILVRRSIPPGMPRRPLKRRR